MPFARSTSAFKWGAHVPAAGGISSAVTNAVAIGASSFAMFLKLPRRWELPPISDAEAAKFAALCAEHGYNPLTDVLPHGQYFINLANPEPEKEAKLYALFVDDLQRCEQLGVGLYNFHPGSLLGLDHQEALRRLADNINKGIAATKFVKVVVENMAGQGNIIGELLADLKAVVDMVEDKLRIGVCVDTCHAFAAGYDILSGERFAEFMKEFDEVVGREYLAAFHLNDSKAPCGAHRDLHQRLGAGFCTLDLFREVARTKGLQGIPIILETPFGKTNEVHGEEIKLLEWMETAGDVEFEEKKAELAKTGAKERAEHQKKFQDKKGKVAKPKTKAAAKTLGTALRQGSLDLFVKK